MHANHEAKALLLINLQTMFEVLELFSNTLFDLHLKQTKS